MLFAETVICSVPLKEVFEANGAPNIGPPTAVLSCQGIRFNVAGGLEQKSHQPELI